MTQKFFASQKDFSAGQVNVGYKRRDDQEMVHAGARVMQNWRSLQTGQLVPRPGRRALFVAAGARVDRVRMQDGSVWFICFSSSEVTIYTTTGALAAQNLSSAYLWTNATLNLIVWTVANNQIVVCYPGMQPQILQWTPSPAAWLFEPFNFSVSSGQLQAPFYRFSVPGATMQPSGLSGQITLTCSKPYFSNSMVGQTLSIVGQQVTILQVLDSTHAICNVAYLLPQTYSIPVKDTSIFQPGQIAEATGENIKIEVWSTSVASGAGNVIGTLMSTITGESAWNGMNGAIADTMTSPLGSTTMTGAPTVYGTPASTLQWQEVFMSSVQGWPTSCFYDRGRLGFCGFPQMTGAVLWGAVSGSSAFWIDTIAAGQQPEAGAAADAAILDIIPGSPVVKYVVPFHGDQFVFTDRGVYYIPIQASSNPLKPGSVEFRQISNDGCAPIQPQNTQDTIVYINAGLTRCSVVRATGSYTLPYSSDDVADPHTDLFKAPVTMSITTGDGQHQERYVYVLNADGSCVVGKFTPERKFAGWVPWTAAFPNSWVTTDGALVYYTTSYPGGFVCEQEDDTLFLDGAVPVNAVPAAIAAASKGPLWFAPSTTAQVMNLSTVDLGDRKVDANGNVIWVNGEDTSSPSLTAGIYFSPAPTLVPFPRGGQDGAAVMQRQRRRRIPRAVATVINSSGFTFGTRAVPATDCGEDAMAPPVLRESTYTVRQIGRSFDPQPPAIIKDRPGPLTICEYGMELTV